MKMRECVPSGRASTVLAASVVLLLAAPVLAFAHAVVYPKSSRSGAYGRYVLRVPNEKAVPTTRVEIRFPSDVRVTSFEDVPGWQLEVLTDSAKRIVGAVWTGTLPPQRFVEFPFIGVNPKAHTTLVWPAFQSYADGDRVEWTGPEGSKRPASSTVVGGGGLGGDGGATSWVAWAALVLGLVSLGLALRKREAPQG